MQIIRSLRAQELDSNNNNRNNRNAMKRLLIKPNHTRGEGMVTSEFVSKKVKGKNQILNSIIKLINYFINIHTNRRFGTILWHQPLK